jgi:hypothetical protein
MQLNEALFVSTPGYVLKPLHMRSKAAGSLRGLQEKTSTVLAVEVAGLASRQYFTSLVNLRCLLNKSQCLFQIIGRS